jgi:methylamine dehydrogenase accessory protein MauD
VSGFWLVSYLALWILVVGLAVVVLSLMRMIGQMHQRLGPAPALVTDHGPEIGDALPELIAGARLVDDAVLRFPRRKDSLLIFVSPTCPTCESVARTLKPFAAREAERLEVVMISSSRDDKRNAHLRAAAAGSGVAFLQEDRLGERLKLSVTPYALWLDSDGVVRAKGLVNNIEHLDSLSHARSLGVASLDEYQRKSHESHQAPRPS